MSALVLAGLLYIGASLAVSPVMWRRRETLPPLRDGGVLLALSVVVGGAVAPVLLVTGLSHVPAATASLLLNLEVVATAVVAALVFREHIGRRVALALTLARR
jgi:drug/metabolite transporter (DMT)-like permease